MGSTNMIYHMCEEQQGSKVEAGWDISVFWQGGILHALTTLGKTSADSDSIEISTNRFQIWTEDFKSDDLSQNLGFQLNHGLHDSRFSEGA